jgi:photosystem II stability/assembly factor-like uncharacterized protein
MNDQGVLFVGGHPGAYRSRDRGATWELANSGIRGYVSSLMVNGGSLYAGTGYGVFRSTNDGASWDSVNAGLAERNIWSLAYCGSTLFAATSSNPQMVGIFRSTDGGDSWSPANAGLPASSQWVFAVEGSNVFVGTWARAGIFLTTDKGTGWTAVNDGLPPSSVRSLAVPGNTLVASIGNCGVWSRPLSEMITSVAVPPGDVPLRCELDQNYPNPFNPTTVIRYQLPAPGDARLAVYDMLGREVAVLVNERKDPGTYTAHFDGSHLASGVYIYRLHTGSFVATRKLLIVK